MSSINWHQRAKEASLTVFNFIDGIAEDCSGEHCAGDQAITKHSPRDGRLLYSIARGESATVDRAVSNARQAFNDGRWSAISVQARKAVLLKLADLIEQHKEEFALNECLDVGKPIARALRGDIGNAIYHLRSSADKADKVLSSTGFDGAELVYQHRKPAGVVGAIVGWNSPLSLAAGKVGPALAMGNSIVLKPSEFTSLSACRLAELALEAGVPPGVFNVVNGAGATVGAALAEHRDVDLIGFVGSSATGKKMMIAAGQSNMKRVILECGGKSPYLVFDDCPDDLDVIAADIVAKAFPNQGAVCVAGTRLLIQDSIKDKLLAKVIEKTAKISPQDPLDINTTFGALINEAHMNKVLGYIDNGSKEGANLILGGKRLEVVSGGYYIEPTIFDQVNPKQAMAQEEIFGPVLSVLTFKDEEEAIQIANDSNFGLYAYASTQHLGRARRLGQLLNVGQVNLLGTSTPVHGGFEMTFEAQKQSGMGFAFGLEGLAAYTVSTTVCELT